MRNHKQFSTVFGLLSLSLIACGSGTQADDDDSNDPGTVNPGSGNSGSGGNPAAPDAAVPPGCDVTKTPSQDACVVNETLGVFVAPASADAAVDSPDGTRGHPFSKMQDAIDAAKNQKKRVYACVGTYVEQITIADGVSMFGNLDCNQSWAVVSDKHASVNAPASPAARADQIQSATRIEAIDMIAPDGTTESPSSIALIATSSPALVIASSAIHAGKGMKGADGVEGEQLSNAATANGQSNANALLEDCSGFSTNPNCVGRHQTALTGGTNACLGSSRSIVASSGGNGGTGIGGAVVSSGATFFRFGGQYYQTPQDLATDGASAGAAAGGVRGNSQAASGKAGAGGGQGADGASASAPGAIGANGFSTADGSPGADGEAGQGGGGAAGYDYVSESQTSYATGDSIYFTSGPSGGAGGCPGLAGTAGKGGGASIAIIVIDSPMTLDTCNVQASDAGDGGKGTFGSVPQSGGLGGTDEDPGACNPFACTSNVWHMGGNGGSGGNSGWSGSGAGGSSIGIAYRGAQVVLVSSVPTNGNAGQGVAALALHGKTIPTTPSGVASLAVSF